MTKRRYRIGNNEMQYKVAISIGTNVKDVVKEPPNIGDNIFISGVDKPIKVMNICDIEEGKRLYSDAGVFEFGKGSTFNIWRPA